MFIAGNVIEGLAFVLKAVLDIYWWIVIVRVVISWVNADPYNTIVRALVSVTEPVLYPIRRRLGFGGGIDFSPIIVLLLIWFLEIALVGSLLDLAARMQ